MIFKNYVEETFDTTDYSDKDKQEFLDSLNHEQFEKLQAFFETMPTLKHEVEVTNPKTQVKSKVVLEEGMVFTIEPGIYIPKLGGVRIEDDVIVRRNKAEIITKAPKELTEV